MIGKTAERSISDCMPYAITSMSERGVPTYRITRHTFFAAPTKEPLNATTPNAAPLVVVALADPVLQAMNVKQSTAPTTANIRAVCRWSWDLPQQRWG